MRLTPTQLRELCDHYDLWPSKKYGQNFLIEECPIKKMVETAGISKNDTVVEIGPGFGILTFALAEKAEKVITFEIEKKLEEYWVEKKPNNVEIVWGNALKLLPTYTYNLKPKTYKLVANIPYQVTSNLLKILLELENKPTNITIMVQKEVAERICSKPGDMSLLSLSVQYYGEPRIAGIVTKGNFWPVPKVDSAILNIKLKDQKAERLEDQEFFRVVKAGFAQKRKQLWNNLSKGLQLEGEVVKKVIKEVCGNEKIRAEDLSVDSWRIIVEKLKI